MGRRRGIAAWKQLGRPLTAIRGREEGGGGGGGKRGGCASIASTLYKDTPPWFEKGDGNDGRLQREGGSCDFAAAAAAAPAAAVEVEEGGDGGKWKRPKKLREGGGKFIIPKKTNLKSLERLFFP